MTSKRRLHRRECTNKVRHRTKDGAYVAIRRAQPGHQVHIYHCPWCHYWHIGAMKLQQTRFRDEG